MKRRLLLILLSWFLIAFGFPSKAVTNVVNVFVTGKDSFNLKTSWKYKHGDNKEWANPTFDDKTWDTNRLGRIIAEDIHSSSGIWWFRKQIIVPAKYRHKTLVLFVVQAGASEIYLDGKLVESFGTVGDLKTEVPYAPNSEENFIELGGDSIQCLAVRFSANRVLDSKFEDPAFNINFLDFATGNSIFSAVRRTSQWSVLIFAVFLTFAIFHLLLFLYYRQVVSNLYYSILALLLSFFWLYPVLQADSSNPLFHGLVNEINLLIFGPCFFLIVLLLYSIFKQKYNWFFWLLVGLTVLCEVTPFINIEIYGIAIITQILTSSVKGIIMVIRAVRRKQPGAWIIAVGFLIFLCVIILVFLLIMFMNVFGHGQHNFDLGNNVGQIIMFVWAFSIPTSMSVYLASDFARTNKFLSLQLVHVKQLSDQNIEKEREKQALIEGQKRDLEIKVKEATVEIMRQKDELSEKNKEITDSINYARRIQNSILPEEEQLKEALEDFMVIYKPKDVVSGDFYWCHSMGDKSIFAVADCTGHGVPGAFMSMIGTSLLNEIVIGRMLTDANAILDELRSQLIITLQQSAQHVTTRDGMDIALCVLDKKHKTLQFAGANNSLYLVSRDIAINDSVKESPRVKLSNDHLLEILPDKQPIGYQEDKMNNPFTKNIIQLHKGDTVFITSDGFIDQFGGDRNKKFTSKRFRELIASLVGLPLAEQAELLNRTIEEWKKYEAQTDDICVMGVRVN